ncbi:CorA family divalent cation transporter [Flavobacterium sp. WC2421]|jgi:magnesium transporter|uniref:CorA family divalent cation transporter n=1 Tax=Flavobacterium sp. WC2409 TaxID=3234139 RepID=A0AB39W5F7_9FLAO
MNIELIFQDKTSKQIKSVDDFTYDINEIVNIQFINYNKDNIKYIEKEFNINTSILNTGEDIEISSHYLETENQIGINFSVPYFDIENKINEVSVCIILKNDTLFTFSTVKFEEILPFRQKQFQLEELDGFLDTNAFFVLIVGFVSDYFADLTEIISKKIINSYSEILKKNKFSEQELDKLTNFSFNNLIIEEANNEYRRIIHLLRKSKKLNSETKDNFYSELNDLSVINEYVQNNFKRIDDLKQNISSKIELEQNKIFKTLTIVTMCISLPMLVAGIYGMNFKYMPELEWKFGYLYVLILIVLSFIFPILWFRKKKWF